MKKLMMVWMICSLPAWAADAPLEKPIEAPLETQESAYVELRGTPEQLDSLLDKLVNEDAFKAASCQIIPIPKDRKHDRKKSAKSCEKVVGIACTKPDSSLMRMVKQPGMQVQTFSSFGYGCPAGCIRIPCPPFNGLLGCCKLTPTGFRPC